MTRVDSTKCYKKYVTQHRERHIYIQSHLKKSNVSPPCCSPMNGRLCVKISKNVMPSEYTSLAALYGPSPLPGELWRLYSHISGAMNSRVPQIVESPCLQESEDNQKGKTTRIRRENQKNSRA